MYVFVYKELPEIRTQHARGIHHMYMSLYVYINIPSQSHTHTHTHTYIHTHTHTHTHTHPSAGRTAAPRIKSMSVCVCVCVRAHTAHTCMVRRSAVPRPPSPCGWAVRSLFPLWCGCGVLGLEYMLSLSLSLSFCLLPCRERVRTCCTARKVCTLPETVQRCIWAVACD